MSERRPVLIAVLLLTAPLVACGPKGSAAEGAADSTAVDSTAVDSTAVPSTAVAPPTDSVATMAPTAGAGTKSATIGRDSAFGPRFLVDSTGKLTRIPEKKRP